MAGAEFGLFDANPSASIDANSGFVVGVEPHYTCESDAQGDCSFIVPIGSGTGAVTQNTRLWAAPINAWITDPGQQTSPSNNTSDFTRRTASSGVWPLSRPGLPVAVRRQRGPGRRPLGLGRRLLERQDGNGRNHRRAARHAVAVEITTFGTDSPAQGYQNFPLTSVATTAEANALKARYAGWSNPSSQGNYTNWDRGLTTAAASDAASVARHLDIAILLTDGNPTVYGPNATGASAPAPPTGPGDPGDPSDPGDSEFVPCTGTSCGETVHDTPPGPPPGAVGSTGGSTPVAGPIANTVASTARDLGLAAALLVSGAAFLVAGGRRRRT